MNVELYIVAFSAVTPSLCEINTAPPRYAAELLWNVELSIVVFDPVKIIAPPSPPVVLKSCPNALFCVKLEFFTIPSNPSQNTAPPLRFATLPSNVQLSIVPSVAPTLKSSAPPLYPASLSIKEVLWYVML